MTSGDQVYRKLQEHLDKETVGFPATETGSDITLLKVLWTPEQALATLCLTHKPEPMDAIYARANVVCPGANGEEFTRESLEAALYAAAERGLIFFTDKDGDRRYKIIPYIVGFYETQVHYLTPEFRAADNAYMGDGGHAFAGATVSAMRTIPIEQSVEPHHEVSSFDAIRTLVEQAEEPIVAFECICRKHHELDGSPCKKATIKESCMAFGGFAENFLEFGKGKQVSKAEAIDIFRQAEEDGLVFQPSNTQVAEYVCSCCGCCCGQLIWQKYMEHPLDAWAANYYAEVDPDECTGCRICVDVCQVNGMNFNDDDMVSIVDLNRCIGCGNCVTSCPDSAITLIKKDEQTTPPTDFDDLQEVLMANK